MFLCFLSLYLMILSLSLIREFLVGFLLWSNLLQYVWTHLGSSWSSIIHEQVSRSYFDFGSVLEHTPFKLKKIGTLARIFTIVAWNRFLISLGRCVPSFVKFGVSDQKLHHFWFSFFRLFTIHLSDFTVHRSDRWYCSLGWFLCFWFFSRGFEGDSIQVFRCAWLIDLHSFHSYWSEIRIESDLGEKEVVLLFTPL